MDPVPVGDIRRFESELLEHLRGIDGGALSQIRETKLLTDDIEDKLTREIENFKRQFNTSSGAPLINERVEAMEAEEVEHEAVKVNRPAPEGK